MIFNVTEGSASGQHFLTIKYFVLKVYILVF